MQKPHNIRLLTCHHKSSYVISMYKYCRDITSIRGFTRETLSALAVNLESREWRRRFNKCNNIPPEHPRASTTDDVECFFSVLRDMIGKDFTHKKVQKFIYMYFMFDCKSVYDYYIINYVGYVWMEKGMH